MTAYSQIALDAQAPDEVELLRDEDILPFEDGEDAADYPEIPGQFWHSPRYSRSQTHTLWAYLTAREHGYITAEEATQGLLQAGVFPHELAIDMLTTCLRSLAEGEIA